MAATTIPTSIRLSPAEKRRIATLARKRGLSPSAYIKRVALAGPPAPDDVKLARLERLAAALAAWAPPAGRGSVHVDGARTFTVDCYNSSPASLLDAAQAFDRRSRASAEPRLFVLGGMAELGPTSARLHRDCGAQLPLRPDDRVVVFGGDAAAFLQGVAHPEAGFVAATIEEAAARVAAHRGHVFLKGSRSFALERCLPPNLRAALTFH